MKPIFIPINSEGKIVITPEYLQKIIDDAYELGFRDGAQEACGDNPIYYS